jgi:hypothetical protein
MQIHTNFIHLGSSEGGTAWERPAAGRRGAAERYVCGRICARRALQVHAGPVLDPTIARIGQGVELHHGRGRREAARHLFAQIWEEIGGEQGDPLHVCVLAHSMADVQDDVHQELVWDQRALAAADLLTDDRVAQAGVTLSVAGLYPSLHLNLAECCRKLGDLSRAREHLRRAQAGIGALGDDEYGQLIKGGLDRLARQLASQ